VSPARRPIAAANWKMHFGRAEAEAWARDLLAEPLPAGPEIVVFPSATLLASLVAHFAGESVALGGQDVHPEPRGAFTGDLAAHQLADAGCRWALVGHSERRRDHAESDALVASKAAAALAAGLSPLVCLGETREERHAGRTFEVLARQVAALPADPRAALAYEPVWAIGTGENATPEAVADAHAFLRARVAERHGARRAGELRILYGGSVTPENAAELAAAGDVDGFLVGGASLDPQRFRAIIRSLAARARAV
jgi:triosephosphate isomerase